MLGRPHCADSQPKAGSAVNAITDVSRQDRFVPPEQPCDCHLTGAVPSLRLPAGPGSAAAQDEHLP